MGAGKNKAHRKKRISKHVIDSQKRRKEEDAKAAEEAGTTNTVDGSTPDENLPQPPSKKKQRKQKQHIKDPLEAHSYLSAWKHKSEGESVWKFNKNTQSWLFRHLYEVEKVPKATFGILMEYMDGLKGDSTRKRMRDDAMRRALRYKNWEKEQQSDGKKEGHEKIKDDAETEKSKEDTKDDDTKQEDKKDEDDDKQIWLSLNDGDKRKEYKRARKVLDVIKVTSESN